MVSQVTDFFLVFLIQRDEQRVEYLLQRHIQEPVKYMMEYFSENRSKKEEKIEAKNLPHRCLTGPLMCLYIVLKIKSKFDRLRFISKALSPDHSHHSLIQCKIITFYKMGCFKLVKQHIWLTHLQLAIKQFSRYSKNIFRVFCCFLLTD